MTSHGITLSCEVQLHRYKPNFFPTSPSGLAIQLPDKEFRSPILFNKKDYVFIPRSSFEQSGSVAYSLYVPRWTTYPLPDMGVAFV